MRNKLFILILILIPLLMIGAAAYYFYGKGLPPAPSEGRAGEGLGIKPLATEPVLSPILSFSGETVWYMTQGGKLFRQGLEPQAPKEEYLLPEPASGARQIIWQKTGSDFIVQRNEAGHKRYSFYDAAKKEFADYPAKLRSPRFVSGDQKIVYDWATDDGRNELKVSENRGQNFEKIADLYRPDYMIESAPATDRVVLFTPDTQSPSGLQIVDLATGQFQQLGEKAAYQGVKFSPDGTKLLAAKITEGDKPNLVVYDLNNPSQPPLTLRGGEIEEATWNPDGSEVILAAPSGFSAYNIGTGESRLLYKWKDGEDFSPRELILPPGKQIIIFVDAKTGYLYKLNF